MRAIPTKKTIYEKQNMCSIKT